MSPWADEQGEPQQQGLELVEDLLTQVEAAGTAGDRATLLCRVAEVYERRGLFKKRF